MLERAAGDGQAIVGNVTQAPRETARDKAAASPPALADSQMPALTIVGKPALTAVLFKRKPSKTGTYIERMPYGFSFASSGVELIK
jgi:hypothetical protein